MIEKPPIKIKKTLIPNFKIKKPIKINLKQRHTTFYKN
jgi:hypothetical protein